MEKHYNKSEYRKNRPYNKSTRRRDAPIHQNPYQEYRQERPRKKEENDTENGLDFDLQVPEVDWEIPKVEDIPALDLPDVDTTKSPEQKQKTPDNQPNTVTTPQKPTQRRSKVKIPPSLGGGQSAPKKTNRQPSPQVNRQPESYPPNRPNSQSNPAAIIGPLVVMVIVLAFVSSFNPPSIVYLFIMFFFGRAIWDGVKNNQ